MCEHSQSGQTPWFRWPSHNGKNRALVYKWSISGWWQWHTNQVWFSLTNERCWECYRNMSYLGWWLILRWRGDNWTNPWEWGFLSYMDLFPYFLDQKAVRRIIKSSFWLTHQSSFPHSTPSLPTSGAVIHAMGGHGDVLSWPPFKDLLSNCWKSCQWASLNHQPLWGQPVCTDPSREGHKGLASGYVRTILKGHHHSRPTRG